VSPELLIAVAIPTVANIAGLAFFLGGLKARMQRAEEWADRMGRQILELTDRIGHLEGQLAAQVRK
jgi:hypothetical protein